MKIKILQLTEDKEYANRFVDYITEHYSDKLEISFFSNQENALNFINTHPIDIILADSGISFEGQEFPRHCQLVYFIEKKGINMIDGCCAICKYQSISDIYKRILEIFAENISNLSIGLGGNGDNHPKVLTFYSASGGVGGSTVAAACARYLAEYRKKSVLYLNLEEKGSADLYFSGEGTQNFSQVLYALAINNNGTILKMESTLKQDSCGVMFYSAPQSILDMQEMDQDTMSLLWEKLKEMNQFQWIVVDMDFHPDVLHYEQMERSFASIFVSDGSYNANYKLRRIGEALRLTASRRKSLRFDNMMVLYNRFSSKSGSLGHCDIFSVIGGINRIENATQKELIHIIASQKGEVFESIIT